jgi:ATP-binding cassette subfamily B protein
MKKSQKHYVANQRNLGAINGHVEEVFSGHNVVKSFNADSKVQTQFENINSKLYSAALKMQFYNSLFMPLMSYIPMLINNLVLCIGVLLCIYNFT